MHIEELPHDEIEIGSSSAFRLKEPAVQYTVGFKVIIIVAEISSSNLVFAGVPWCSLLPLTNERVGALQHYPEPEASQRTADASVSGRRRDENKAVIREQGKVALVGRHVDMMLICSNTVLVRKQREKENKSCASYDSCI
jgi:hypothetical protein